VSSLGRCLWALLWLAGLAWPATASADVRRFGLLVANNDGPKGTVPLLFAHADLARMQGVLQELGGYEPRDLASVTGGQRRQVLAAFGNLRPQMDAARAAGDEVLFLFYYSGHADGDALKLGPGELSYDELERMLDTSGADVRLAIIDACQSGALTRTKAAKPAPSFVFELEEQLGTQGTVILTSSTGDEASQESDEIGGSYFTHFLVSGLYGAADRDRDGQVTLAEAYDHVYAETVLRTSGTREGAQHPSFGWDLAGEGDLVLTDLDTARASLIFDASQTGAFAVFDLTRRAFVAEVDLDAPAAADRRLAVRPGRFQIQERFPTHLRVADAVIQAGESVSIQDLDFRSVRYEDDVAKGWLDKQARRARLPDTSVQLVVSRTTPLGSDAADEFIPPLGGVGASWRLQTREGRWAAVDLQGVRGRGAIQVDGIDPEPTALGGVRTGVEAGFSTLDRTWQAGAGLRVEALYLRRTFPDEESQDAQRLNAPAVGGTGFVGWHPGRFEFDLSLRLLAVPVPLEDERLGFGLAALSLSAGYRF